MTLFFIRILRTIAYILFYTLVLPCTSFYVSFRSGVISFQGFVEFSVQIVFLTMRCIKIESIENRSTMLKN